MEISNRVRTSSARGPGYIGDGTNPAQIAGWVSSGACGINPIAGADPDPAPFGDNGYNPTHFAFLEGWTTLQQTVTGLAPSAKYRLTLEYNARNCCGDYPIGTVVIDGVEMWNSGGPVLPVGDMNSWHRLEVWFKALPGSTDATLVIKSTPAAGGDSTLLVDNVRVTQGLGFVSDFNAGLPAATSVFGSAFIDGAGGVDNSGVLKLTTPQNDQVGSFIIEDFNQGDVVTGFQAHFKLFIGGGTGADGFSFNFAKDLPNGPIWEGGAGSGLTVSFDTFDNGDGEAPAIDIVSGGLVLGSVKGVGGLFRANRFVDVLITLDPDGRLSVVLDGAPVYSDFFIFYTPTAGRFALGARTGGATDNHFVDDLSITTQTALPARPVLRSALPFESVPGPLADVRIQIQAGAVDLDLSSMVLKFDGWQVNPVIAKQGDMITLVYLHPFLMPPNSLHLVTIEFSDETGLHNSYAYNFAGSRNIGSNGDYYEFVGAWNGSWELASAQAAERTLGPARGYLATLTGPEDEWLIEGLRQEFARKLGFVGPGFWVGGSQAAGAAEPAGGWTWINNEGPIPGVDGVPGFSHWLPGQPDDACGPGSENYLAIGDGGAFGWSDHGCDQPVSGYVVEYTHPFEYTIELTTVNTTYTYQGAESAGDLIQMILTAPIVCRELLDTAHLFSAASPNCGLDVSDHGYLLAVNFTVAPCQAGPWSFRFGPDFGRGGALFVDGVKAASLIGDLWWDLNWDSSSTLKATDWMLAPGGHTLQVIGFEDCCAGNMSLDYRLANGVWQQASLANLIRADRDADGVVDCEDVCSTSDLRPTVIIDSCDTGVPNIMVHGGCTTSDLIANCATSASEHGLFVSCVEQHLIPLVADGILTGAQKGKIVSCAARSSIGMPAPRPRP